MDNIPNVVENMPNLENITKIISLFERNIFEDYSVREISKKILLDYKTVRKTIKKLLALELIKLKIKGKSNMIALNLNHSDVKTYLSFASYFNRLLYFAQNAKLIFLLEEINRLNLFDITVVLFGSHVTGEQKKHSDLDLLLISKNNSEISRVKSVLSIYDFKNDFNVLTPNQYQVALKNRAFNLTNQVLTKHIVLKNPEYYWSLTLRGLKSGNRY